MPASEHPRVCVIGAGASGIAMSKALHERGIPFDCFELSDRVGGLWVYRNSNGVSSSYNSLHLNTSRSRTEYSDFPMPASFPDFPRHDHLATYFDSYVDHFGFRDRIRFQTGVRHVRREGGVFQVMVSTGETLEYDAVAVANGHLWDPRWPEPAFPESDAFTGEQIHSHEYKHESQLAGKRVVVLGMGNSAMDIVVDASYHAESTVLATRRGAHIVPKYLFGRPMDTVFASEWVPARVRWALASILLRLEMGRLEQYGLPKPDHRFGQAHPTISGRLLDRLAHGAITVKPSIAALEGDRVRFTDGTELETDMIVYCTGYKFTFPFFDENFVSAPGNEIGLYRNIFHPAIPGLYFVGLVSVLGAVMPIVERQSQLIADHLTGVYALPAADTMRGEIERRRRAMVRRYVTSRRHTVQVDFDDYLRELRWERRAGARRAARTGWSWTPTAQSRATIN